MRTNGGFYLKTTQPISLMLVLLIISTGCLSLPGSDKDNDGQSGEEYPLRVEMSWDAYVHPDQIMN